MKKWTALILALVMCFALCACGANGTKKSQEEIEKTNKAVESANHVLDVTFSERSAFSTWFNVDGNYNEATNVYTVNVTYNMEGIENWVVSEYPAAKTAAGLRESYVESACETLKGDSLDALIVIIKGLIPPSTFPDELGTEVVYQFTDEIGRAHV